MTTENIFHLPHKLLSFPLFSFFFLNVAYTDCKRPSKSLSCIIRHLQAQFKVEHASCGWDSNERLESDQVSGHQTSNPDNTLPDTMSIPY